VLLMMISALYATLPDDAAAASIKGNVVFAGAPPAPKKLAVTIDQYVCGKEKDAEELVVSPQKGIRNVVVWLQNPPQAAKWDPPSAPVAIDQKECVFTPRIVLVPAGGTVDFLNSDRLLHNLHATPKTGNPAFNRAQPKGRTIPITFSTPEIIPVNCDLHSWMRAWVVVMDHPFYAVTNPAGEFVLTNVPPGKFVLQVWHETLGRTSKEVTVGNQDFTGATIEMSAR
jgi:plastocyanin